MIHSIHHFCSPNGFYQSAMNHVLVHAVVCFVFIKKNQAKNKEIECTTLLGRKREKEKTCLNRLMIWFLNNQAQYHPVFFSSLDSCNDCVAAVTVRFRLGTFSLLFYKVVVLSSVEICLRAQQTAHPPTTLSNSLFSIAFLHLFSLATILYTYV